jgi:uncharacterized protein
VIRVSDATAWAHCPRLAWFALHPPPGEPVAPDPFEELIRELGDAHEADVLARFPDYVTATSADHTQALIAAQTPVIYQPRFVDTALGVVGDPDFLLRENADYRVADAKLALSLDNKKAIKAQLGMYRRLARSKLPALVYLGNGDVTEVGDADAAIAESFLVDMQALAAAPGEPETHYSYTKCSTCLYSDHCVPQFRQRDELTLNPAVDARAAAGLRAQGITTLDELAASDPAEIRDVPYLKGAARKQRAVLQALSLKTGEVLRVRDADLPPGDYIHFDIESDPLAEQPGGEVYLWGFLTPPYLASSFAMVWKDRERGADERAWREFLATVRGFRETCARPVFVHYSPYERTQIRAYAKRYDDETDPVVRWLLGDDSPLLDIQVVTKAAFVLPVMSYGLKSICRDRRLVNFQWRLEESGSQWSVVRYHDYLAATDPDEAAAIKAEILTYNEDDVRATAALVDWLRAQA